MKSIDGRARRKYGDPTNAVLKCLADALYSVTAAVELALSDALAKCCAGWLQIACATRDSTHRKVKATKLRESVNARGVLALPSAHAVNGGQLVRGDKHQSCVGLDDVLHARRNTEERRLLRRDEDGEHAPR